MGQQLSLNITLSLLIGIFTLYILSAIGFIFGLSINLSYILIAVVCAIYAPVKLCNYKPKETISSLIIIVLLTLLCGYISEQIMDMSNDGQWYHQTGIIFLKKGWNPIYTTATSFLHQNWNVEINGLEYVNSYPKFAEIVAANIYYLTENIELGKTLNFLSLVILGFYTFYTLKKYLFKNNTVIAVVFSILMVINPVSLAQMHTFYVDNLVYVYFMLMVLSLIDIECSNSLNKTAWLILTISAIILANIKLVGLIYTAEILFFYGLYLWYFKKKNTAKILKKTSLVVVGLLLVCAANPYFANIAQGKHILYPVFGSDTADIMEHNMPTEFHNKSRAYKLFMSTFSRVDNSFAEFKSLDNKLKLKAPFTVKKEELLYLRFWDVRQCGFGVLWSGILILSFLLSFFIRYKNKKDKSTGLMVLGLLTLSVLLNLENWWARYVPQFYAIPILVLALYTSNASSAKQKLTSSICCLIIFINSAISYKEISLAALNFTEQKQVQLNNMEKMKRQPDFIKNLEQSKIRDDFSATVLLFLDKYGRK